MAQLETSPVVIDLNEPIRMPFGAERKTPLQNLIVTPDGGRKMRGGQVHHMGTALSGTPTVMGIHDFWVGATQTVVISAGGKIWKEDGLDGTFDDITKSGLDWSDTAKTSAIQMNDILGIWNADGDTAQKWNQSDATTDNLGATNATTAKFATSYRGRGFAAGVAASPDTLWYSAVGNIDATFTAFVVGVKDGLGGITGMIGHPNPNVNLFFVFKERGIYAVNMTAIGTPAEWEIKQLSGLELKLGCPSHHTIKAVPVAGGPDIWFLGNDGNIYSLNRVIDTEDVGLSKVTDGYETSFREITTARLTDTISEVDLEGSQYCLFASVNSQESNNRMFTLSYRMMGPMERSRMFVPEAQEHTNINAASVGKVQINNRQRIVTGDYVGFLNRQFSENIQDFEGAADEAAIEPSLLLFNLDGGNPDNKKNWQSITLHQRPSTDTNLNFKWYVDGGEEQTETINQLGSFNALGEFLLSTDRLASQNILLVERTQLRGEHNGYYLSMSLGKTASDQGMEVFRIVLDTKIAGR